MFGALSLIIITQIYAVNFKFKKLKKLQPPLHLKELGKTRIASSQEAGNFSSVSSLLCMRLLNLNRQIDERTNEIGNF